MQLVALFEGAYLELSRSGLGLHIMFTYLGEFPAHTKKNTALNIELYHDKRYILLGTPQRGTPLHNGMAEAASIIAKYFPASADTNGIGKIGLTVLSPRGMDPPTTNRLLKSA